MLIRTGTISSLFHCLLSLLISFKNSFHDRNGAETNKQQSLFMSAGGTNLSEKHTQALCKIRTGPARFIGGC